MKPLRRSSLLVRSHFIGLSFFLTLTKRSLVTSSSDTSLKFDHFETLTARGGASSIDVSKSNSMSTKADVARSLEKLGGGAINEKKRNLGEPVSEITNAKGTSFDPCHHRSHLYHALEGLDRYPNYMSRWNTEDMSKLEQALQGQLNKVQRQSKDIVTRRKGIDEMVHRLLVADENDAPKDRWKSLLQAPTTWEELESNILDPRMMRVVQQSLQFKDTTRRPSVQDVLCGTKTVELDPSQLERLMEEELFDVYSLPLLSFEFCERLREYVRELSKLGETEEFAHLQVGRRAVDLDTVGVGWVNDLLFQLIMRPIARLLFGETESGGGELDWRQGYVAGYSVKPTSQTSTPRHRLVSHTDDSEVTLNICLGDEFVGGALNFRGLRGTPDAGELIDTFEPQLGKALLHAGRHLHEVTQVMSGDRYALIVWARSWSGVRTSTCPCCWLNRRQNDASPCICGPKWN